MPTKLKKCLTCDLQRNGCHQWLSGCNRGNPSDFSVVLSAPLKIHALRLGGQGRRSRLDLWREKGRKRKEGRCPFNTGNMKYMLKNLALVFSTGFNPYASRSQIVAVQKCANDWFCPMTVIWEGNYSICLWHWQWPGASHSASSRVVGFKLRLFWFHWKAPGSDDYQCTSCSFERKKKMIGALWESLLASCWFVTGHLVQFKPHSDYNWHSLKKTTPCTHPPHSIANVMCVVAAKTAAPPTNCLPSIKNHPSTERPGKFLVDPANIQRCPYGA